MAVFGPIPLPRPGYEEFGSGLESGESLAKSRRESQLLPYQMMLAQAQAEESKKKALQSQILTNMLSQYTGIPVEGLQQQPTQQAGYQLTPEEQKKSGEMKPGESLVVGQKPSLQKKPGMGSMIASLLGLPTSTQVIDGQMYSVSPFGVENLGKYGESKAEQRKEEVKKVGQEALAKELPESYRQAQSVENSLDVLSASFDNPLYENISGIRGTGLREHKLPFLGISTKPVTQTFYSPEEQKLHGIASTAIGNIQKDFGKNFKGGFTRLVSGVINDFKPSMSDAKEIQRGKVLGLKQIQKYSMKFDELTDKFVNEGYSGVEAQKKAAESIDKDKMITDIFKSSGLTPEMLEQSKRRRKTLKDKFKPNKEVKKFTEEGKLSTTEGRKTGKLKPYTDKDISDTAKATGKTEDEVRKLLKEAGY